MVLAALVTACRLAICPTRRSPLSVKPTTLGVVRPPSLLGTICTVPPSKTATQQLVVPKSIPMISDAIAAGYFLRDRVRFVLVGHFSCHSLVNMRIEGLAYRDDRLNSERLKHIFQ